MAQPLPRSGPLTLDEYLEIEESSRVRHEFVAGEMYAMVGGTARHNLIALNIASALREAARGGPSRVYMADLKLRTPGDRVYYPDVMVACVPVAQTEKVLISPCVVVEVLSPGTARIDRLEKLAAYQRIAELDTYLIVDQARRRVERHWRDARGEWRRADVVEGAVPVACLAAELALDEMYEGVEVEP